MQHTQLNPQSVIYIVRDTATKGCDFLLWSINCPGLAALSFIDAIADGLNVERMAFRYGDLDKFTAKLIGF